MLFAHDLREERSLIQRSAGRIRELIEAKLTKEL
jgi:hypothetical protein